MAVNAHEVPAHLPLLLTQQPQLKLSSVSFRLSLHLILDLLYEWVSYGICKMRQINSWAIECTFFPNIVGVEQQVVWCNCLHCSVWRDRVSFTSGFQCNGMNACVVVKVHLLYLFCKFTIYILLHCMFCEHFRSWAMSKPHQWTTRCGTW